MDDFEGNPDRDPGPTSPLRFQPYGTFPTEAVLDTLLFAVGGVPYKYRPAGTLSAPGMFAGFDFDTLDYRFTGQGLPLDVLLRYQAVVLYTGYFDAVRDPQRATGSSYCCLRYEVWKSPINALASYVNSGGHLWLFGDGVITAVQLRPGADPSTAIAVQPAPGSFAYDYLKLRSDFGTGGRLSTAQSYLTSCVPFLPDHVTPGAAWPPDSTQSVSRSPCDDPRVAPGSRRNEARWSGLPCLTLTQEFLDWPSGFVTGVNKVQFVASPNRILESMPTGYDSALDTLYLYQAKDYIATPGPRNPDGKPVMCAYEGPDHGAIVWSSLPLWMFDRTQLQKLAAVVLGSFGIQRSKEPGI